MARQKLIDDEELDRKKATANQDAQKFIEEIERNIHLENEKLTALTSAQRLEI